MNNAHAFLLSGLLLGLCARADAGDAIPAAYVEAAAGEGVPPAALYRLALSRSGVALTSGSTRPWPWTLTAGGETHRYEQREAALAALRRHLKHGTKDLRVGLMLLPWARYKKVFSSPEASLEPRLVLKLGARLLAACFEATGDWERALARCSLQGTGKPPFAPNWARAKRYAPAIHKAAARHGLDPALVAAVVAAESNFNRKARSSAKAQGLMQLIPATAKRFGVADPWNAQQNLHGGTKYLRWLLDTFDGDLRLALAGYNAGEKAVIKYGHKIPPYPETQAYVPKVLAFYRLFLERGVG